MKRAFILLAGLFFGLPAHISPGVNGDDFTIGFGNNFYDNCALAETILTGNIQREKMVAMFCLGYAEGLTHGIMAADLRRVSQTFCMPSPDVTNSQVVRIIRKYIADHPEEAHEVTSVLAVEALRKAFPCKN
jgi:hypothetical protein